MFIHSCVKMGSKSDFVMEPNGLCFFCLKRAGSLTKMHRLVKQEHELNPDKPTFPIYSLQCLSRFLKMDISKVFRDQELIPKLLLTKVENSALKVELCEECAQLLDKFLQLHKYLEKVRIELVSSLSNIYEKFLEAEGTIASEELKKFFGGNSGGNLEDGWGDKLDIMDVLRTEAIQKSHGKISSSTPRIKVEKLTGSKISRQNSSISVTTRQSPLATGTSGFNFSIGKIEEENHPIEIFDCYDGDDMTYYSDDFEKHGDDPTPSSKQNDAAIEYERKDFKQLELPNRKHQTARRKARRKSTAPADTDTVTSSPNIPLFNHKSRTYRCPACLKVFRHLGHCKTHISGVHDKIKYSCTLCSKTFSTKPNYNAHYKVVHKRFRVMCPVCNSLFAHPSSLRRHQRLAGCGKTVSNKHRNVAHLQENK